MAKILIIDDDKAVVDSTADMLKSFDFNVITATDGKKGFELADLERPDVIILDWMMPGYSGMQFIKDYRDQGYKTPVLFLTGKGDLFLPCLQRGFRHGYQHGDSISEHYQVIRCRKG